MRSASVAIVLKWYNRFAMVSPQGSLTGLHVRLEPLEYRHIGGLLAAASVDRSLYEWSAVPGDEIGFRTYVETAIEWREAGTAVPFAILRVRDGAPIGSTRFFDLTRFAWPSDHPRSKRTDPDAGEIGYTWFTSNAICTVANTETKLLMLTHAFERWDVLRVCFHTDARNERSRRALERIGAKFEGSLRAHRIAADFKPRDSYRYSIIAPEWPEVKRRLLHLRR
jgi:N-acetyltransferase